MKKQTLQSWIVGIFALAALAVFIGLAWNTFESASAETRPQQGVEDEQVAKLREQLQSDTLSAEGRRSLEEKLVMAERMATQRAVGAQSGGSKDAPPLPLSAPAAATEAPLVEGIFPGSQGLIKPSQADVLNVWQGERDGVLYQVFAGSTATEPRQGALIVAQENPDKPVREQQGYLAPTGITSLRILSVEGMRVLLETDLGGSLTFDLETRSFE